MPLLPLLDFDEPATLRTVPPPALSTPSHSLTALVVPPHSSLTYLSDYLQHRSTAASRHSEQQQRWEEQRPLSTVEASVGERLLNERRAPLIEEVGDETEQQQRQRGAQQGRRKDDGAATERPQWVDALLSAIAALDERVARIESCVASMERAARVSSHSNAPPAMTRERPPSMMG